MKKTFLIRFIPIVQLICCCTFALGQQNLRPGFIITNAQDTIYGQIDFRTDLMNSQHCIFLQEGESDFKNYQPFEIAGYRFTNDGKYYISKQIEFKSKEKPISVFLEYLLQGIRSLYYYESPNHESAYFIEYEGKLVKIDAPNIERNQKEGITYAGQKDRYIPILQYIFQDYPKLNKKIARTPYSHKGIIGITKEYHYAMCKKGEDCIEFETKIKSGTTFEFTPYMGMAYYTSRQYQFMHRPSFYGGISLAVSNARWLSSISGLIDVSLSKQHIAGYYMKDVNTIQNTTIEEWALSCRLGARYTYDKHTVQPFAEVGAIVSPFISSTVESMIHPGWYVGVGSKFRIPKTKKQSIVFRLLIDTLYIRPDEATDKWLKTFAWGWSASLGYTF